MSESHSLPTPEQVNKIVIGLFGDDALVKKATGPIDTNNVVVAKYADSDHGLHRLVVCDLAFANNAGAALTMISPGVVADAIKAKEVPENIFDNFREVLNIFVNLFSDTARGRLVLDGVDAPTATADEATATALKAPVERADFEVTVPRYGSGRLTLLAC
ncbi:MAG: hypothetical protein KDA92_25580 [Planctomycetales bacterium]|nr:hypothetical protein [Planctomycetales bacterium]MCA9169139.1 hypothetical protein [Planctomycetales bacterium]